MYKKGQEKIEAAIAKFPPTFGLRGFPGDTFRISLESSFIDDSGKVVLYTQRHDKGHWVDFAKCSIGELTCELTCQYLDANEKK